MPVATASSTVAVPATIPARYGVERRTPKAEPAAVRLIVAGPGLPMIASAVTISDPSAPHGTSAIRAVRSTHGPDATRPRDPRSRTIRDAGHGLDPLG